MAFASDRALKHDHTPLFKASGVLRSSGLSAPKGHEQCEISMVARAKAVNESQPNLAPQKLHALLDAADSLTATLSVSEVLTHILRIGGDLTGSEAGSVILHATE